MTILDKILFILVFIAEKFNLKKKQDKKDRYTNDQNEIQEDPVKWVNDRFGDKPDDRMQSSDSKRSK